MLNFAALISIACFMSSHKYHLRETWNIAWPVVLSQMSHTLITLTDNVLVGGLGKEALAATGLGIGLFAIVFIFGLGVSMGATPLIAKAHGEGNRAVIGSYLANSLWLNMGLGLMLYAFYLVVRPHLDVLGQDPQVMQLAITYLDYMMPSLLAIMLFQTFKQFAEGLGITKPAMYASYASFVINAVLAWGLIYGHWGLPGMGVAGAGLATLLARVAAALFMILAVANSPAARSYITGMGARFLDKVQMKELWTIGAPIGLQMFFEVGCFASAAIMAGWLGSTAQAAHQITLNLAASTFMAITGVSAAASVRVGFFYGAKDRINMRQAGMICIYITVAYELFTAILFLTTRHILPGFFVADPAVENLAATLLIIAGFFQFADGVQVVAQGTLRGIQDVKIPTIISFISYWVVGLGIGYFYGVKGGGGIEGIWWGLFAGLSVAAVLLTFRWVIKSRTVNFDAVPAQAPISIH